MNVFDLLDAVGGVEDGYVTDAQGRQRPKRWIPWAAAAVFCIAAGIGIFALRGAPSETPLSLSSPTATPDVTSAPGSSVTIPTTELPSANELAMADMLAFVIVDGKMYTQAEGFFDQDSPQIEGLLGEKIGDAIGNIDEWSDASEYRREFASSVEGELYTVQGYDPEFRLCVRHPYTDDTGKEGQWFLFLERLNGITLTTGADLFESRLHLRDRVVFVQCQSHEDWDWNNGGIREAALSPETWNAFLDAVDEGRFVYTWKPDGAFYENHPNSSVYDTPNQAHLILTMTDGTTVRLRLLEGGYVSYDPLGWYFVQIPGEAFQAVYEACGGTHQTDW